MDSVDGRIRRKPDEIDFEKDGVVHRRCRGCEFAGPKEKYFPRTCNWRSQYYCPVCRNPKLVRHLREIVLDAEQVLGRPLHRVLLVKKGGDP